MKCYVCNYEADKFGSLTASGAEWSSLIGRLPLPAGHVGSVDVHVCPNCGALHSDMRGKITAPDRKPAA